MSAVALPHVPSARAPSSAASLTQRSVHSASSTASHVSATSLRHSFGEEEDEDDASEDDEHGEEDEEPHESSSGSSGSGGLWDEVESFLNKPSPSFAALAKDTGKSSSAGANVLPTLRGGGRDRKQPVAPPGGGTGNQSSGPRGSRPSGRQYTKQPSTTTCSSHKAIDPKLLQEAFAYAEKIQRVNFDDGDDDESGGGGEHDQQREADRRGSGGVGMLRRDTSFGATSAHGSSSASGSGSGGGPRMPHDTMLQKQGSMHGRGEDVKTQKKKTVKSSAYGVSAKPQPSKKKASSTTTDRRASVGRDTGWDASPSSTADPSNSDGMAHSRKGNGSSSAATMDQQTIQSLVSNLQNGTAVDELRRELAASQQSLAMSRLVIQEAAKSFFRK